MFHDGFSVNTGSLLNTHCGCLCLGVWLSLIRWMVGFWRNLKKMWATRRPGYKRLLVCHKLPKHLVVSLYFTHAVSSRDVCLLTCELVMDFHIFTFIRRNAGALWGCGCGATAQADRSQGFCLMGDKKLSFYSWMLLGTLCVLNGLKLMYFPPLGCAGWQLHRSVHIGWLTVCDEHNLTQQTNSCLHWLQCVTVLWSIRNFPLFIWRFS